MTTPRTCVDCDAPVTRQSTTGRCRPCATRKTLAERTPEQRCAMTKRGMARNPELKRFYGDCLRAATATPEHRERARALIVGRALWLQSSAHGPEARAKAGRTLSEQRLAWCPRELRDDYRTMRRKVGASEARRIILDQHERDMAAFRQKLEAA